MYTCIHNKNEITIEQPLSLVKSRTYAANVTASIIWLRKVDLYSQGAYEPAIGVQFTCIMIVILPYNLQPTKCNRLCLHVYIDPEGGDCGGVRRLHNGSGRSHCSRI